jgi:hypothetical protein
MHKLQHLCLSSNKWVDEEVVMSIQSYENLSYLDISATSVGNMHKLQDFSLGEYLKYFKKLACLNILDCSVNDINGNNLI